MAGQGGPDGATLTSFLASVGVDTSLVMVGDTPTGHALIQVDVSGGNCIIVHPGANRQLTADAVASTLAQFGEGDLLLIQNETNLTSLMVSEASARGMVVAYNPSPVDADALSVDIDAVDYLFVNELEAAALSNVEASPDAALDALMGRHPNTGVIMTLGADGAVYGRAGQRWQVDAARVDAVDTTGAGDTFTGFFLGAVTRGHNPWTALAIARDAASQAVQCRGAAVSIPTWAKVTLNRVFEPRSP